MADMSHDSSWNCDQMLQLHEDCSLKLDGNQVQTRLACHPRWRLKTALQKTLEWHHAWRQEKNMHSVALAQIANDQLQNKGR